MARASANMDRTKTPQPPSGGPPLPRSRRGPRAFFQEVVRELKKVTWPSRAETNRMTGIVLAVCALVVLILTAMNVIVDTIMKILTKGVV